MSTATETPPPETTTPPPPPAEAETKPKATLDADTSLSVTIVPSTNEETGQQEFKATLTYVDKASGAPESVELTALEPLIILNLVNDAMRHQSVDLRLSANTKAEADKKAAEQKQQQAQQQSTAAKPTS